MRPAAWYCDTRSVAARDGIFERLAGAGLGLTPVGEPVSSGPGLLVFDTPSTASDALRRSVPCAADRVLAVAAPETTCTPSDAWELLEAGAADVIRWEELDDPPARIGERLERWQQVDGILESSLVRDNLVGSAPNWMTFLRLVVEAGLFTGAPLLITGETGTGKELAAQLVHTIDPRPGKKNLIVVDCTTIVPDLAGSELFGHERGAFTGAAASRDGAFKLAENGTLFLDEVGELPLPLQAQLLRAVQEKTYKRVGGNTWRRAEFRLICATNRDLEAEVAQGRFRRDLYYRIAGLVAHAPPLRERASDILPLAEHFLREQRGDGAPSALSAPVRTLLLTRDYPGNVRDLRQLIQAIGLRHHGHGPVTVGAVPPDERPQARTQTTRPDPAFELSIRRALAAGMGLKDIGRIAEETAMSIVLAESGSVREAAGRLAVTKRAIQLRRAALRDRPVGRGEGGAEENGVNGHSDPDSQTPVRGI